MRALNHPAYLYVTVASSDITHCNFFNFFFEGMQFFFNFVAMYISNKPCPGSLHMHTYFPGPMTLLIPIKNEMEPGCRSLGFVWAQRERLGQASALGPTAKVQAN
jgi:hypothetical protein